MFQIRYLPKNQSLFPALRQKIVLCQIFGQYYVAIFPKEKEKQIKREKDKLVVFFFLFLPHLFS